MYGKKDELKRGRQTIRESKERRQSGEYDLFGCRRFMV